MRHLCYLLLIATIVVGIGTICRAQSTDELRLSIARDVTDEIAHDQLALVVERFSPDLKDSLTQDKLKAAVSKLIAVTGAFQKQLSQETRTGVGTPIYVSRSQFEKFKVELGMEFDEGNQIVGIWITPVSDLSSEGMEESAKAITDLLRQGRFDLLNSQFDEQLRAAMTTDHLDASWSHVLQHLGNFKTIKLARKDPEYEVVDVRCEFEHGEIIVRIAFDLFGQVAFLWMLPVDAVDMPHEKVELFIIQPSERNA
jgi:hypothetical protein